MTTHPYLPLYVDDYEAATAHLTAAEDGVYSRLLRLCWRTPGCSLPNDHAWIARKIRVSGKDYETIARPVLEEFFKVVRGRLVQKRLKDEYENISRKKSARVKAGKMGGDAKALKTHKIEPSNASDLLAHTRAFPEPEPEPDTKEAKAPLVVPRPSALAKTEIARGFLAFWAAYPKRAGKDAAGKAFAKAMARIGTEDPLSVILAGIERAMPGWDDPQFIPHPATWLNQGRWEDDAPTIRTLDQRPSHGKPDKLAARHENYAASWAGSELASDLLAARRAL